MDGFLKNFLSDYMNEKEKKIKEETYIKVKKKINTWEKINRLRSEIKKNDYLKETEEKEWSKFI